MPGKVRAFSFCIDDSLAKGDVSFIVSINPDHRFPEISFGNNDRTVTIRIVCRDVQSITDSLFSIGRGLCIVPANQFTQPHRLFLIADQIAALRPLRTESSWVALAGDGSAQFSIGVRPALSAGDSLAWIFRRAADTASHIGKLLASIAKLSVFVLDSSVSAWRYAQGGWDPAQTVFIMRAANAGPFALAVVSDIKPPQIRALVDGREIVFLDYAAKDKPFNILMNDPSGIIPSSIMLRLNGKLVDPHDLSSVSNANSFGDITMTVYPRKERSVDSLSVFAEDFAGNATTAVFAYMPGEDLRITFFSCHPNPFTAAQDRSGRTAQTIRFAYLITDVARDVSITIYTIGGNAIWKWRTMNGVIGYQEVEWDGKTSDGYRIANGTYYAKLVATGENKKVVKRIRIAKLEGY